MSEAVLAAIMIAVIANTMPLMLAAAGETVGEQAGVLNVGLEGVLLVGAYCGFAVSLSTGSLWLGVLAGTLAGCALSAVMVLLSVVLGANQIVVGIGITLAGTGLTSMLYDWNFGQDRPRLGLFTPWEVPLLSDLPVVGRALFAQPGTFAVGLLLVAGVAWWLHRTSAGLRLRTAGQLPAALDAAGGNVRRVRALAVLFGGAMAGFGGATLSLVSAGTFTPGMTHGMGFLAIVVTMLGAGKLHRVALISLAYGACVAAGTAMQIAGVAVANDLITMAPFVAVMVALALLGRRSALPPALATQYVRGARG